MMLELARSSNVVRAPWLRGTEPTNQARHKLSVPSRAFHGASALTQPTYKRGLSQSSSLWVRYGGQRRPSGPPSSIKGALRIAKR
eukprot:2628521-Prymnesium_polylepis.1